MNTRILRDAGAYFLAGHADSPSASPMVKYAEGLREMLARAPLNLDVDRPLAPSGRLVEDPLSPIFNGLVRVSLESPLGSERPVDGFGDYWKAYDVDRQVEEALDAEGREIFAVNGQDRYQHLFSSWQGHATVDFAALLQRGLPWYRDRIRRGLEEAENAGEEERREFFLALETVMSGIETVVQRYAAACADGAADSRGARHDGMSRLAGAFRKYQAGPPRDFFEALQLVHLMNAVDGYDNVGRLDQHLYPFYARDVNRGTLTPDRAEALLAEAFDIWGSQNHWQVVVGGTDREGRDASNDLTGLILAARGRVDRPKPSVSVRLSEESPAGLLESALDLLAKGLGQPALYNNDLYIRAFQQIGVPAEAATEFVFGGCSETHIGGRSAARDSFFNLAKALEAVFYNGRVSSDGPSFGVETGPPEDLRSFEEFVAAYRRQVEYLIDTFVRCRNHVQRVVARLQPALVRSIFVSGCLESGRSNSAGGSEYDYGMIDVYGIPNVANSLLAVRRLVYEDQALPMVGLVHALRDNFRGHEEVRAWCRRLPKYGNDQEEVDGIAAEVAGHAFEHVLRQRIWNGDGYYAFCASAPGAHVMFGKTTGATPDGRLAGTPLANSVGAMQGTDLNGPTAMLKSASKLPLSRCVGTPVVNLSIRPELLLGSDRETVAELVRTFFRLGGMQLQVSLVDRAVLLDALEHPEAHPSLMVRVSGYSARFTELSPDLQQEILERTVH